MSVSDDFRRCLEDLDVEGARKIWAEIAPGMPQPESADAALVTLHLARTTAESVPFRLRAYSHRWLTDAGLPSNLPDHLRPEAERVYPKVVPAVGISVTARDPEMEPLARMIESAMSAAVSEVHADGKILDTELVRSRMVQARSRATKEFFTAW